MDTLAGHNIFAPMLGLITAMVATIGAVLTAVFGPFKNLRLPVESVPGSSRGALNVFLFAPLAVSFLSIDTATARPALIVSLVALVAAFVCYQQYGGALSLHRYTKPRVFRFLWIQRVREDVVIGGSQLQPDAAKRKRETHATEQTLLAEAEYKADEIWTRPSRVQAQLRIERWYYGFMLCALLTVVIAALATQTVLSGESPLVAAQRLWNQNATQQH
jgi:hypothetical protein